MIQLIEQILMLPDWKDISYLQAGSVQQQQVYHLLSRSKLLHLLKEFNPILVGTYPLDIAVSGSDLDIICEVQDLYAFSQYISLNFSHHDNYHIRYLTVNEINSITISFCIGVFEIELFGQPLATEEQSGYKHMVIEARLLKMGGDPLKKRIIDSKMKGIKTEPAFAELLSLKGNPYNALLDLQSANDQELKDLVIENLGKFSE